MRLRFWVLFVCSFLCYVFVFADLGWDGSVVGGRAERWGVDERVGIWDMLLFFFFCFILVYFRSHFLSLTLTFML